MTELRLNNYAGSSPSCIAIGVFDGVHLGHQRVLSECRTAARQQGLTAVGLTFDPHPLELLAPTRAPEYICSIAQRVEWMSAPGLVEQVVVAPFTAEFAALSARQFVEEILIERLRANEVRVGADFRFGHGRQGSVMDLESMGDRFGFRVNIVHAVATAGERISSTHIRHAVLDGDVDEAGELLGRPFTLRGTVVRGKQLGRTIGYPTINLQPDSARQLLPRNGVYVGYATLTADGKPLSVRAAISVGTNPTTDHGDPSRKVEAYLMDGFDRDVYDQRVDLSFTHWIRDELKFDSLDELVKQIGDDVSRIEELTTAKPS